jgi:hypothetical protein
MQLRLLILRHDSAHSFRDRGIPFESQFTESIVFLETPQLRPDSLNWCIPPPRFFPEP